MLKHAVWFTLATAAPGACNEKPPAAGPSEAAGFKHENTADNLKALVDEIRKATHANDTAKAAALTRSLLATREEFQAGLKDGAAAEMVDKMYASMAQMRSADDAKLATLFKTDPARTEVKVHGATTEAIAKNEPGSVVHAEFPGGAVKAAAGLLRPGATFYEVEVTEPGKDLGMKYHLFYWSGKGWRTLGPVWRALGD